MSKSSRSCTFPHLYPGSIAFQHVGLFRPVFGPGALPSDDLIPSGMTSGNPGFCHPASRDRWRHAGAVVLCSRRCSGTGFSLGAAGDLFLQGVPTGTGRASCFAACTFTCSARGRRNGWRCFGPGSTNGGFGPLCRAVLYGVVCTHPAPDANFLFPDGNHNQSSDWLPSVVGAFAALSKWRIFWGILCLCSVNAQGHRIYIISRANCDYQCFQSLYPFKLNVEYCVVYH